MDWLVDSQEPAGHRVQDTLFPRCCHPPASNRKLPISAGGLRRSLAGATEARSGSHALRGFSKRASVSIPSDPTLLRSIPWATAPRPQPSSPHLTLFLSCLTSSPSTGHRSAGHTFLGFCPVSQGLADWSWGALSGLTLPFLLSPFYLGPGLTPASGLTLPAPKRPKAGERVKGFQRSGLRETQVQ